MAFGLFAFFFLGPLLVIAILIGLAIAAFEVSPWVWLLIVAFPVIVAVTVAVFGRFAFRTIVPVRDLIQAAGSLADGDYSVRVDTSSSAVKPVVNSFNSMADRLEYSDEQRRQLLGDLGADVIKVEKPGGDEVYTVRAGGDARRGPSSRSRPSGAVAR